ncbi:MAG: SMI1/KNR4 family protein [Clostridiaceae bacterium]|jgi:hypothetical protein|nr:SMI1/KNR4 family protein [Clostridiaceae bacterium]
MNIKSTIEDLVKRIKQDKGFASLFSSDPVKAVEKAIGVKLPDDQIKSIIDGIKAKLSVEKTGGAIKKAKGLFGKK